MNSQLVIGLVRSKKIALLALTLLLLPFSAQALETVSAKLCDFKTPLPERAFACNAALARTINLGNIFDSVREGMQGAVYQDEFVEMPKKAGFTAVRLAIRWDARAGYQDPYPIQPQFFERIDGVVKAAKANGLAVIIDMHHFVGMTMFPDTEVPRFVGVWKQVAEHYKNEPATVVFEVMNEPHGKLNPEKWQKAFDAVLPVIRASNPDRTLIVGGSEWNSAASLENIELPASDKNIIGTFHFYEPFYLTHQGAEWVSGSTAWLGTKWTGDADDMVLINTTLDRVVNWGKAYNRPVFLGEFGVYSKADHPSRLAWTRAVRKAAEERNISWAYWELMSSFGILDPRTMMWREDLLRTLIDAKP